MFQVRLASSAPTSAAHSSSATPMLTSRGRCLIPANRKQTGYIRSLRKRRELLFMSVLLLRGLEHSNSHVTCEVLRMVSADAALHQFTFIVCRRVSELRVPKIKSSSLSCSPSSPPSSSLREEFLLVFSRSSFEISLDSSARFSFGFVRSFNMFPTNPPSLSNVFQS